MTKNKKAQEEMVGFVLIMLVVAVIFLVFLGIFVRQGRQEKIDSTEVSQFLNALTKHTSECTFTGYSYENLGELFDECRKNRQCDSGKTCDILKDALNEMINASWVFSNDSFYKGYAFRAVYDENIHDDISPTELPFSPLESGACEGAIVGADLPIANDITISLDLCL